MNGYGSHTFKLVNASGEAFYVKFHFKSAQGIRNLSVAEADRLSAADPDYSIRDLYNAIAVGDCPAWTLKIQVMSYEDAQRCTFNPFDVTKVPSLSETYSVIIITVTHILLTVGLVAERLPIN